MPVSERDEVTFARYAARLASDRQEEWNWDEAERLLVEVLKVQYQKLGPGHYEVAAAMCNLAKTCQDRDLLWAAWN